MVKNVVLLFFLIGYALSSRAQSVLTGNIFDDTRRSLVLEGVRVRNLTTKTEVLTDKHGFYVLPTKVGELVSFSHPGYHSDTIYVSKLLPKNIYLRESIHQLPAVDVTTTRISPFMTWKDPEAVPARPIDYSKERGGLRLNLGYGKFKREMAKDQELLEEQKFIEEINTYFTISRIYDLVKQKNPDIRYFMDMYRPTIGMVSAERPFNYDYYIVKSYHEWLKLPEAQRKPKSLLLPKSN